MIEFDGFRNTFIFRNFENNFYTYLGIKNPIKSGSSMGVRYRGGPVPWYRTYHHRSSVMIGLVPWYRTPIDDQLFIGFLMPKLFELSNVQNIIFALIFNLKITCSDAAILIFVRLAANHNFVPNYPGAKS